MKHIRNKGFERCFTYDTSKKRKYIGFNPTPIALLLRT